MQVTVKIDPNDQPDSEEFLSVIQFLENLGVLTDIIPCQLDEGSYFPWRAVAASWYVKHWGVNPLIARRLVLQFKTPGEIAKNIEGGFVIFENSQLNAAVKQAVQQVLERLALEAVPPAS